MATRLTRNQLAQFLPTQELIRAFESIDKDVGDTLPADIEALTISINDAKIELSFADPMAEIAELKKQIEELRLQIAMLTQPVTQKEDVYDSIFG